MDSVLLSVLIAGGLLIAAVAIFISRVFKSRERELKLKTLSEMRISNSKMVTPLRIQACERLLLFLERVQLPVLVKRIYTPDMAKDVFHISLLHSVGEEFEHNMAQQLYVGSDTWTAVKSAKEELLNQINTTFNKAEDGTDVALIAQALVALPNPFVEQAIAQLKKEFNEI